LNVHKIARHYHAPKAPPLTKEQRGKKRKAQFWANVNITANPDECWEWLGGIHRTKYGTFSAISVHPTRQYAHIWAYALHYNVEPTLWVLHSCDNPPCCNPAHLREGTPKDNSQDREQRGRGFWGTVEAVRVSTNATRLFTDAQEVTWLEQWQGGTAISTIASDHNLAYYTVYNGIIRQQKRLEHSDSEEIPTNPLSPLRTKDLYS